MSFDRLSVLIVDDNAHMRRILATIMRGFGCTDMREANDGAEALEFMRGRQFDLALVDMNMQPIDGVEFVTMVRRSPDSPSPMLPIIMVTGHTERSKVAAARDAGATEFVAKPVTAIALLQRIQSIVMRPRVFVKARNYVGPDRRRRDDPAYKGAKRRTADESLDLDT
jgi:CheY-like chemotaxis protein